MAAVLNSFNLDTRAKQSPIFNNAISMYFPWHQRQEFNTKDNGKPKAAVYLGKVIFISWDAQKSLRPRKLLSAPSLL
ncbi:unnamed protein product, partial [Bubo scandiacus]